MKNHYRKVPARYVPASLSRKDAAKQRAMLRLSRRSYKKGRYVARPKVASFRSKPSSHVDDARRMYGVETVRPGAALAAKTGCSVGALRKIVRKGEGAYYSSGSRPNQTARSWGIARLASAITSGKAAAVDYSILEKGCDHAGKAFRMARRSVKKFKHGQSATRKVRVLV